MFKYLIWCWSLLLVNSIGCSTVRKNGVVCDRFETHTHRYTFYGSEDFRDYNQNFLENYRKLNPKKDSENILISHLIQNELLYKICRNDKKIWDSHSTYMLKTDLIRKKFKKLRKISYFWKKLKLNNLLRNNNNFLFENVWTSLCKNAK